MQPRTLDDGTVRLRPHRDSDVDGIVDQCTDAETVRWTTIPSPYTAEDAKAFLAATEQDWHADTAYGFAIADHDTDEFLGNVKVRPDGQGQAELGYCLRPVARGRGVLTSALRQLIPWSFAAPDASVTGGLGLEVLHWKAAVGNWASRRAAWSLGFRVEGTVRGLHPARGVRHDAWIGSLRRGDPLRPTTRWLRLPRLTGDSIVLREFRQTDVQEVLDTCIDAETRHWLGALPNPYTVDHALSYIASREEEHAAGRGLYWAAADARTDRCLGSFSLMQLDETTSRTAEVGYWVHPAARSRGVATEAVGLLAEYAAEPADDGGLGLHTLQLRVAEGNDGSRRVAEKAGFSPAGRQRQVERLGDGSLVDLHIFDRVLP